MGKFLIFLSDPMKFCYMFENWLHKNRWHTSWKFQLEKISNKKAIAKQPLKKIYEMNSSQRRKTKYSNYAFSVQHSNDAYCNRQYSFSSDTSFLSYTCDVAIFNSINGTIYNSTNTYLYCSNVIPICEKLAYCGKNYDIIYQYFKFFMMFWYS